MSSSFSRSTTIKTRFNVQQPKVSAKNYTLFLLTLSKVLMVKSFYVHRALKYVIRQHNRRTDNNNNDNNNNNNDNDNNDNNNSNNKMDSKTIKDIYIFTFTLDFTFQVVSFTTVKSSSAMDIPLVCLELLLAD